jgi:hypothetical protein
MRKRLFLLSLVVIVAAALTAGAVALAAKKPPGPGPGPCPSPAKGCICYMLYAPVACGPNNCTYSNQCFASCAGWSSSQCTPTGPGPIEVE